MPGAVPGLPGVQQLDTGKGFESACGVLCVRVTTKRDAADAARPRPPRRNDNSELMDRTGACTSDGTATRRLGPRTPAPRSPAGGLSAAPALPRYRDFATQFSASSLGGFKSVGDERRRTSRGGRRAGARAVVRARGSADAKGLRVHRSRPSRAARMMYDSVRLAFMRVGDHKKRNGPRTLSFLNRDKLLSFSTNKTPAPAPAAFVMKNHVMNFQL
ncbi:hypothetical protein EVAR_11211_1 [Eumeta japonica]|uniref:Uncharacterized protein n=1 Tax=Eumeta variegata TaxID=151549 RepID=A0A4C1U4K9_EUMVA|nr:hypothetical protein EVAR_11211_1 [Eumeta japonica]